MDPALHTDQSVRGSCHMGPWRAWFMSRVAEIFQAGADDSWYVKQSTNRAHVATAEGVPRGWQLACAHNGSPPGNHDNN